MTNDQERKERINGGMKEGMKKGGTEGDSKEWRKD